MNDVIDRWAVGRPNESEWRMGHQAHRVLVRGDRRRLIEARRI
jgi:hypothetical protein